MLERGGVRRVALTLQCISDYCYVRVTCRYIIAVGSESGRITLYSWGLSCADGGWNLLLGLDQSYPFIHMMKFACHFDRTICFSTKKAKHLNNDVRAIAFCLYSIDMKSKQNWRKTVSMTTTRSRIASCLSQEQKPVRKLH